MTYDGPRILILDDDQARRERLAIIAQQAGCGSITLAATAIDAIAALLTADFDAALLDHDLDGPDAEGQVESPPNSGMTVALFLAKSCGLCPLLVLVHSLNTPRALAMVEVLRGALARHGYTIAAAPVSTLDVEDLRDRLRRVS